MGIEIHNWVGADAALGALNVVPPLPSSYARFLEKLSAGLTTDSPTIAVQRAGIREWQEFTQRGIANQREGFLQNYLAHALTLVLPPAPAGQGWRLPETVSDEESNLIGDALTSAHLR